MKQVSKLFDRTASGSLRLPVFATVLLLAVVFTATFAGAQTVAADTSTLTGAGGHHGGGGELKELLDSIVDHDQILADALGITVEELEAAREEGKKLDELIDELGLDQETVRQDVQDATEAAVEQAVADGLITEEEAEAILNRPAPPDHGNRPPGGRPGGDDGSESSDDTTGDNPVTESESTEPPGPGSPRGDGNQRVRR